MCIYVRKSILCFLGNFMPHLVSFVRIMFKPDTFYLSQFFNACTILNFFLTLLFTKIDLNLLFSINLIFNFCNQTITNTVTLEVNAKFNLLIFKKDIQVTTHIVNLLLQLTLASSFLQLNTAFVAKHTVFPAKM